MIITIGNNRKQTKTVFNRKAKASGPKQFSYATFSKNQTGRVLTGPCWFKRLITLFNAYRGAGRGDWLPGPSGSKGDNAIHLINHYPADITQLVFLAYPLDRDLSSG